MKFVALVGFFTLGFCLRYAAPQGHVGNRKTSARFVSLIRCDLECLHAFANIRTRSLSCGMCLEAQAEMHRLVQSHLRKCR